MKPCCARRAAVMPATAPQPGWKRLVQAPSSRKTCTPAAVLAAMPWAETICSAVSPSSLPATTALLKCETTPVAWKPAWWKPPFTAAPMRIATSMPAA